MSKEPPVTVEVEEIEENEGRLKIAHRRFNARTRQAINFLITSNAGGLIVGIWFSNGVMQLDGSVVVMKFAVSIFAGGYLCAGLLVFAMWRQSAAYVSADADLGLIDSIPLGIGDWLVRYEGMFAVVSFSAVLAGLIFGLIAIILSF